MSHLGLEHVPFGFGMVCVVECIMHYLNREAGTPCVYHFIATEEWYGVCAQSKIRTTKIMFGRGRISGRKTHGEWFVSSDGVYCQTQWFILFKWHFIKVLVALCFLFHDKESNKQNIHGNNGN
jgi:hypothetical protein